MTGLRPDTARCLRSRRVLLVSAAALVANTLERLCDSALGDLDRENVTAALRSHLADVQMVVGVLDEALFDAQGSSADPGFDMGVEDGHVLTVPSRRWQRRRPGRRS